MSMVGLSQIESVIMTGVVGLAVTGIFYAIFLIFQVLRADEGTERMREVSSAIKTGAKAYLKRQFKALAPLMVILTIALFISGQLREFDIAVGRAVAFLVGASFSMTVGYAGMSMASNGNVRVASAARSSFNKALQLAYRTGTINGMLTDGLGLLGGSIIYLLYLDRAYEVLIGFGFGGALLALFMRVGGGIYTKAADVGADLVGKIEKDIPEDDPRNAAVIADLVGDQVGDCAGMAADIFESYEVTMVSAMILGYAAFGHAGVIFPLMVRAMGVLGSIIGTYAVKARTETEDAMRAITRGFTLSAIITIIGFAFFSTWYMGQVTNLGMMTGIQVFGATFAGIILALTVNTLTEHFTSLRRQPVKDIAKSSQTGAATVILQGLSVGYEATVWAIFTIAGAIIAPVMIFWPDFLKASYGVALSGIGMLTLTGNNVAMDAFGPTADNAGGIIEMSGLEKETKTVMDRLDAVGNTTKAITKGIAIGSAVIAAVALFNSYIETTGLTQITVTNPYVFVGLLIGGAIPFLFSSASIRAVGRGAFQIVKEVRRQFNEIPGIWEGTTKPDYAKCVDISTRTAQRELIGLGTIAILTPITVGFILKEEALGGFLAGAILVGQLLAVFMATSGAAWDNAKKTIEGGLYGGKGSDPHKATVIGDTVGDPLKDTSGPALNPMIKVINLVALIIAPIIVTFKTDPIMSLVLVGIGLVCATAVGVAVWWSKRAPLELKPSSR